MVIVNCAAPDGANTHNLLLSGFTNHVYVTLPPAVANDVPAMNCCPRASTKVIALYVPGGIVMTTSVTCASVNLKVLHVSSIT